MEHKHDTRELLKAMGNKFQSLRKDQAKELDEIARALRITPALLVRIERGDHYMYPNLLAELCNYYHITLDNFFRDVES